MVWFFYYVNIFLACCFYILRVITIMCLFGGGEWGKGVRVNVSIEVEGELQSLWINRMSEQKILRQYNWSINMQLTHKVNTSYSLQKIFKQIYSHLPKYTMRKMLNPLTYALKWPHEGHLDYTAQQQKYSTLSEIVILYYFESLITNPAFIFSSSQNSALPTTPFLGSNSPNREFWPKTSLKPPYSENQ